MKVLHRFVLMIAMVSLVGCFGSKTKSYGELSSIAESKDFQSAAIKWVSSNLPNGDLSDVEGKHHYGGGMAPGSYWVENKFSWSEFGMAEHSKVYLMVSNTNAVEAVLFQERSRIGIYVIPQETLSQNEALPEGFHSLSPQVGLFNVGS